MGVQGGKEVGREGKAPRTVFPWKSSMFDNSPWLLFPPYTPLIRKSAYVIHEEYLFNIHAIPRKKVHQFRMMSTLLTTMAQSKIYIVSPGVDFCGICSEKILSGKFISIVYIDFKNSSFYFYLKTEEEIFFLPKTEL